MNNLRRNSCLLVIVPLFLLLLFPAPPSMAASTEVNRYRNFEDRLKTEEELRPLGHDFLIDVGAAWSKEIKTIIDDGKNAANTTGTDTQKLAAITAFLRKYDKTEQFGHAKVIVGIPLPSFTVFGAKIVPDLRAAGSGGASLTLKTSTLNGTSITIGDIPGISSDVKALIGNLSIPLNKAGTDMVQYAIDQGAITAAQGAPYLGQFIMPDLTLPNVNVYAKVDLRFILGLGYTLPNNFFGNLDFIYLMRTDKQVAFTDQLLKKDNGKVLDLKNKNTQSTLNLDYRLGYQHENYRLFGSIEDLKIATLKEKKSTAGDVFDTYDPLLRFQADADYRLSVLKLSPFAGVHKRKGYSLSNGMYLGAEGAVTVWGDRLFLALKGMVDKEYFTVTPSIRLWLIQIEGSFRKVRKTTTDDGNKTSNILSFDFRFFI